MNLKRLAALLLLTASGSTLNMANAMAYAQHEHPFAKVSQLPKMSQQDGDRYCRSLFGQMLNKSTRKIWYKDALGRAVYRSEIPSLKICPPYLSSNNVNHVWAHRNNSECIANV